MYKQLLLIVIPMVLQNFFLSMNNSIDNAMVSSLGSLAVSAVGRSNAIVDFIRAIINGFSVAAAILAAQYFKSRKSKSAVAQAISISIICNIVFSLICVVAYFSFKSYILSALIGDATAWPIIDQHLSVAIFTSFLYSIIIPIIGVTKLSGRIAFSFSISLISNIFNIVLNYILIFGRFGAPRLEARGAAIATLLSVLISLIIAIVISLYLKHGIIDGIFRGFKVERSLVKKSLFISTYSVATNFIWNSSLLAVNIMIAQTKGIAIEASAAVGVLEPIQKSMTFIFSGFGTALVIMISDFLAKKEFKEALVTTKKIIRVTLIAALIVGTIIFITATNIAAIFFDRGTKEIALASTMLRVLALTIPLRAFNALSINGIFSAGADSAFLAMNIFISTWGVMVPLAAIAFFLKLGPMWIYILSSFSEIASGILFIKRYFSKKWMKSLID